MKTWSFLINTFLVITEHSYRTAKKIGDYTLAALEAKNTDPFFGPLYLALKPIVDAYNAAYNFWISKLGTQKSLTSDFIMNLKLLSSVKVKYWDITVQGLYIEGTPEYISIFPNHRTPFQNGSQEDRIAACEALSIALDGIDLLASVKDDVDAFIVILKESFNKQKSSLSTTGTNSDALDAARIAMCVELYGVLGTLMSHFKNDPTDVEPFFDLETIRNHEQTLFKGTIDPAETNLVMTHTFADGEQVRLINKGATTLRFALVPLATSSIQDTSFVEVAPNDEAIVTSNELGLLTSRFLKVLNTSDAVGNKYSVMLL